MTWRDHPQHYRGYLYIDQPPAVFKARVNMATIEYPILVVDFDTITLGTVADAKEGMLVLFGSTEGADDLGRSFVHDMAASAMTILWSSQGDEDGELNLVDNAYITVLDTYPVHAKPPRIIGDELIKQVEGDYADNMTDPPPIVNLNKGVGTIGEIDSGTGYLRMTITAGVTLVQPGQALHATTAYQWDHNAVLVSGGGNTDTITLDFAEGRQWVELKVMLTSGQYQTRQLLVVAVDPNDRYALLTDAFEVEEQSIRIEGQTLRLRVLRDLPRGTYPDGTVVLYYEHEYTAGVKTKPVQFAGFLHRESAAIRAERTGLLRDTSIECVDVAGRLRMLPGFPQVVENTDSPQNWQHMANANIDRYLHYLLKWHSSALKVADFTWSGFGDSYPFPALGSDGQNLYDQVDQRARAIAHRFTCDSIGRLLIVEEPLLQDSGDRTLVFKQEIDETDWTNISFDYQRHPRIHWLRGEGVIASDATLETIDSLQAVFCVAPGIAPGQGEGEQKQGQQLVIDQAELNAREGHRYARLTSRESLYTVTLAHSNGVVVEPAIPGWVHMTISAEAAAQRGISFTDERFIAHEVLITHSNEKTGRVKEVRLRLERETVGTPAVTEVRESNPNQPNDDPDYPQDTEEPSGSSMLLKSLSNIALVGTSGKAYITGNFRTPSSANGPHYGEFNLGLDGIPIHGVVDAFSPLYLGTGDEVNCWIATTTKLYHIADLAGARTATLQQTFRTYSDRRCLDSPFGLGAEGRIYCVSAYADGVYFTGSTDFGDTFSAETLVGTAHAPGFGNESPGIHGSTKDDGLIYISAATGATSADGYRSDNHGSTWAAMSTSNTPNIDPLTSLAGDIHVPWHNNAGEKVVYFGGMDAATGRRRTFRVEADGTTITDISPFISPDLYFGPSATAGKWQISTWAQDRRYVLLCGVHDPGFGGSDPRGIWVSSDYGDTWIERFTPENFVDTYHYGVIAGNDYRCIYFWGPSGRIGYSENFGAYIDDRSGNLNDDFAPGNIIMIAGV